MCHIEPVRCVVFVEVKTQRMSLNIILTLKTMLKTFFKVKGGVLHTSHTTHQCTVTNVGILVEIGSVKPGRMGILA